MGLRDDPVVKGMYALPKGLNSVLIAHVRWLTAACNTNPTCTHSNTDTKHTYDFRQNKSF